MRSPADVVRRGAEWAARVTALGLLAWMIWAVFAPSARRRGEIATNATLPVALRRWTIDAPDSVHLRLTAAPGAGSRDWLRALRRAGTQASWSGSLVPLALEARESAEPSRATQVWAAAPPGATVSLADSVSSLDSARVQRFGASFLEPATIGAVRATVEGGAAAAGVESRVPRRGVLVLGRANWETKFLVVALEERGWTVEARLTVAPGVEVDQGIHGGASRPPDTLHHVAVVVADSVAGGIAARLVRYVRDGGGLVLVGRGLLSPGLASVAPGTLGARVRASALAVANQDPRGGLAYRPIAPRSDAVVLERRRGHPVAAARRERAGRVLLVGYEETWRWRLAGGEGAPAAHRGWWSGLVAAVARVPVHREATGVWSDEAAPASALVAALGAPAAVPDEWPGASARRLQPWMLGALFILLIAEWGSRRLRGAP